ncbi:hypothetical protein XAC3810_270012 [Xanthomonas citri pv. citri]|nr:hypothetical protein XAC3810_270012 [Xanthomonas citri pv. citri]
MTAEAGRHVVWQSPLLFSSQFASDVRRVACLDAVGRPHRVAAERHAWCSPLRRPAAAVPLSKTRPGMRECAPGSDPGRAGRTGCSCGHSQATRARRVARVASDAFGGHAQQHRRDGRAV